MPITKLVLDANGCAQKLGEIISASPLKHITSLLTAVMARTIQVSEQRRGPAKSGIRMGAYGEGGAQLVFGLDRWYANTDRTPATMSLHISSGLTRALSPDAHIEPLDILQSAGGPIPDEQALALQEGSARILEILKHRQLAGETLPGQLCEYTGVLLLEGTPDFGFAAEALRLASNRSRDRNEPPNKDSWHDEIRASYDRLRKDTEAAREILDIHS